MVTLNSYGDFIRRVDELGFMAFSDILPGWTSLSAETSRNQWHTWDAETDPWQWKDRAAKEKHLAFGCILNGHKGFVSKEWYPVFYKAYHPESSFEERWEAGEVNQTTLKIWHLFNQGASISTDEIRQLLGVTKRSGAGPLDTKLKVLQAEYQITVCGNRRKINAKGEPYGWPANNYERVTDWAPSDWLKPAKTMTKSEARKKIADAVCMQCDSPDIRLIVKTLGLSF